MSNNTVVGVKKIHQFLVERRTHGSFELNLNKVVETAIDDLGAELFEFAVVVPLLLMLLIGIIWIGRAYNVYETITRACREGTRYAVLPNSVASGNVYADPLTSSCSSNTNTFKNYVVPVLKADDLDPAKVLSYCQKADWMPDDTALKQCGITISFSYPIKLAIPFTSLNLTTIDLRTQAQMRLENQTLGEVCP